MRHVKLVPQSRSSFCQRRRDSKTAGDRTQRARIELYRLVRANRETAPPRIAGFARPLSIEPSCSRFFSGPRELSTESPKEMA